jgi:YD repeat-containing protein
MLKSLLPNAQVQTWDYLPLTGVSSRTDANGQTTLYEYDGLGRLKSEKRVRNGVSGAEQVQEYEYNYQNQ